MVDMKTLESIAAYAKIRMEEGDLEAINATLAMIHRINEADVPPDPMGRTESEKNRLREDVPGPSMSRDDLLRNAPMVEAGCISVPKILGGESQ
jgi:aspartyl-tRNA(Asn)/glutamyl-tRNA(Gln) amidotransferase subunit C